jgi:hypothetical protein
MTTAARTQALYVALELGQDKWHLAFATQAAEKPRFRAIPARDLGRLAEEIHKAKERFRLPADAPVRTCYEAGRDGFWVHRALVAGGIDNVVVDSSSIEVDRRRKRVKSDPVDAAKLLNLLCRYHAGESKVWRVVRVPAVADEDRRAEGPAAAADGVQQPHPGAAGVLRVDGRGERPVPGHPGRTAGLGGRSGAGRPATAAAPGVRGVGGRARPGLSGG